MSVEIVVFGSGYGSVVAINSLEEYVDDARITWASKDDYHLLLHESHRAIHNPSIREAITIPIEELESSGTRFVRAKVPETEESSKLEPETLDTEDCIGIDLGVLSHIHTSDDLVVDQLDVTDEYDRYAREQRTLDRKEHGAANWERQRLNVATAKRKIKCKVLDFQRKLANWLVSTYDAVFVEDRDVQPMLETSQSAKNKQDVA